jgi:hypothetical protein
MQHIGVMSNRFEQKTKNKKIGIGAQKSPKWDTSDQFRLTIEIAALLDACLFCTNEAFSHTFLLEYILSA